MLENLTNYRHFVCCHFEKGGILEIFKGLKIKDIKIIFKFRKNVIASLCDRGFWNRGSRIITDFS